MVKIHFHWDIHSDQETHFEVMDKPRIFKIEPSQGEFPPLTSITFDIYFSGIETVYILIYNFLKYIFIIIILKY